MGGNTSDKEISFLTLVYLLLTITFPFRLGFYWLQGVLTLLIAFGSLFYFFLRSQIAQVNIFKNSRPILVLTLIISLGQSLIYYGGNFQEEGFFYYLSILLLAISFALALSHFFEEAGTETSKLTTFIFQYRFSILFVLAILLRFFMIVSSPNPQIDVFYILKEAPLALLQGRNPYSISYTKVYEDVAPVYFSYWPGAFLLSAPFSLVFGEPRLLIIAAEVLTAFLIYKLLKKRQKSPHLPELVPLIFLYVPRAFFATSQGWIDPVVVALLTLFAFLEVAQRGGVLSLLILGISFSIKQTIFPLSLLAYKAQVLNFKRVITAMVILTVVLLPFVIWNRTDFWQDTVEVFYRANETRRVLIENSLTLNSLVLHLLGFEIPLILKTLIWGGIFSLIMLKIKQGWAQFFLSASVWFFGFFLFSNQSYYNYYYFVGNLLMLTITFLPLEKP